MDAESELAVLRAELKKVKHDLHIMTSNYELADSAARVQKHGRDELSEDLVSLRKRHTALKMLLAPLQLLHKQLQSDPGDQRAWDEAHVIAKKAIALLEEPEEDPDTDPDITLPVPRAE